MGASAGNRKRIVRTRMINFESQNTMCDCYENENTSHDEEKFELLATV